MTIFKVVVDGKGKRKASKDSRPVLRQSTSPEAD
jgi:hypothetical protein